MWSGLVSASIVPFVEAWLITCGATTPLRVEVFTVMISAVSASLIWAMLSYEYAGFGTVLFTWYCMLVCDWARSYEMSA